MSKRAPGPERLGAFSDGVIVMIITDLPVQRSRFGREPKLFMSQI
jgi:hypothetical protein